MSVWSKNGPEAVDFVEMFRRQVAGEVMMVRDVSGDFRAHGDEFVSKGGWQPSPRRSRNAKGPCAPCGWWPPGCYQLLLQRCLIVGQVDRCFPPDHLCATSKGMPISLCS